MNNLFCRCVAPSTVCKLQYVHPHIDPGIAQRLQVEQILCCALSAHRFGMGIQCSASSASTTPRETQQQDNSCSSATVLACLGNRSARCCVFLVAMPLLSSCHALERGRLVCSPSSHAHSTALSMSARLRSPHWHGQHRQCHVLCQAEQQPAEVASTSSSVGAPANGSQGLATAPGSSSPQNQQPDTPLNRVSTGPLWNVPWDVW